MDGLLFSQVGLDALLMPLAHVAMADQNVKYHHQHLHRQRLNKAYIWVGLLVV